MKFPAKEPFNWIWITVLFAGLCMVTVTAQSFAVTIGDKYNGGIVFYVDDTGQHGLIAATTDASDSYCDAWNGNTYAGEYTWSTGQWKVVKKRDYAFKKIDDTSTAIGQGAENTRKILAKYPAAIYPNSAAAVAAAYRGGGYSDWFLPSKDELNLLYLQKGVVGGFVDHNYYWSSSMNSWNYAWAQYFSTGLQYFNNMSYYNRVRAVRAF